MLLADKKVSGLIKDKNNGAIMTEFVDLKTKMGVESVRMDGKKDIKKAKDIKSNIARNDNSTITQCLNEEIEMTRHQSCIQSKLHEMYTRCIRIINRSSPNVVPDSMETLPWRHWRIPL